MTTPKTTAESELLDWLDEWFVAQCDVGYPYSTRLTNDY